MKTRTLTLCTLMAALAIAIATPIGTAFAKHGADDAAGEVRGPEPQPADDSRGR